MNEERLRADGYFIRRFPAEKEASTVYLHGQPGEAEALSGRGWTVVSVEGVDWNDDLTPWPAPAVFRGGAPFGGRAHAHLERLTNSIIPAAERGLCPKSRWIMGYSLAGMFAVYAVASCTQFDGAASVSGSMWYPDFLKFLEETKILPRTAYFSVGDREKCGRNPVFRSIETETCRAEEILRNRGVRTAFRLNSGGHFGQSAERMVRALEWLKENEENG